ncbi:MAG: CHAT domain-containing protein [Ideonella sp.]|nr:CHAT domain-containing protein [Ideonella sp.]
MVPVPARARVRRLIALGVAALSAHAPSWSQLAQHDLDRLFQSVHDSHQPINASDWAGCLAHLDETATLAHRAWTQTSLGWFNVRMRCEARALQSRGQPVTAETLAELTVPALAHLARMPSGAESPTGARMLVLHGKWRLMGEFGLNPEAEREERQTVQALLEAAESGQNAVAREEADRWAHSYYGQHDLLAHIQALLWWIDQRHGPGHRMALILRRAVSFAYRSADRNAEALTVMDETAQLAMQRHPGDQDLRMMIAGERAPCLAANGLWLEARDEFIALRDWMLQHKPSGHGNLMRMNYHLAAIANVLGDHDQAEFFADAADRHAQQSALPNDRVEVQVAHLHRAEARMLRGVPGAVDEVRRELERNSPADGGTGAPAFGLAKLAHRSGDAELMSWARAFLDRHAYERLQPLQPSRALVDVAVAWSVAGSDPARSRSLLDRALARSLSDRDPGVSVQSAFAMARQLAPTQPDAAVWWFKRGANALQTLRQQGRMAQDDSMHRATLADHEADLREFIALLIDEGATWRRDALRVLREEELYDFTRRSRQRAAAARTGALALTAQERQYEGALQPLVDRMRTEQTLADARARPAPLVLHGLGWVDDPASEAVLVRTQGELRALLDSLSPQAQSSADSAACKRLSVTAGNRRCQPDVSGDPPLRRDLLPPGTARLQYFVRETHLDILVTTTRGWHRHRVPMARSELNRRVHAWRTALLNPTAEAMGGAREFYELMIRPVQARLHGVHELRASLDGALRYLPLAALHDGHRHLVQRFSLVMDDGIEANRSQPAAGAQAATADPMPIAPGPSVRARAHASEPKETGVLRLAAFGRTAPDADHAALPGVEAELKSLAMLGLAHREWRSSVRVLQDQAFTARSLHETLAAAPRVVHIASHFHLAAAQEESSYLLLGDGYRLPLSRLAQMPWQRVRLVLLSACDSAVGESPLHGREFNGLAGVLRQAGVDNVLASLWPIADASTASFMTEFYRPMTNAHSLNGRAGAPVAPVLGRCRMPHGWPRRSGDGWRGTPGGASHASLPLGRVCTVE